MRNDRWLSIPSVLLAIWIATLALPTMAQNGSRPPNTSSPSVASSEASDRANAIFGDWTLRCERNSGAQSPQRACELDQMVHRQNERSVLAQIAVGRVDKGGPLRLTVVVPMGVTLEGGGAKMVADGQEPVTLDLHWTRCIPGGCFASATLPDDAIRKFRVTAAMASLTYRDIDNREVRLPLSFRGFGEALDALSRALDN